MLINRESLSIDPSLLPTFVQAIDAELPLFRATYPNFVRWMNDKVIPGLRNGERTIVIQSRAEQIASMMILKHTETERKICTLRVREPYQRGGMGVRMFEQGFKLLGTETPLVSVSSPNLSRFDDIFRYFGFELTRIYDGIYLPRTTEYAFNGLLNNDVSADMEASSV